jgi:hypothetical protein
MVYSRESPAALMRLARHLPIVLVLSLVLVGGVAAACHAALPVLPETEDVHRYYAKAATSTSGAFLTTQPEESSAAFFTMAAATTGASSVVNALQSGSRQSLEFPLKVPLGTTSYINLTKPIVGQVYWTTSAAKDAGVMSEVSKIRVELFVGGVLAGGDECARSTAAAKSWESMAVKFRPEVARLAAGDAVVLKVTRISGLSDILIGLGGAQTTYLEVHSYPHDPLASGAYVEKNRLVTFDEGQTLEDERSEGGAWAAFLALPMLGLLALRRRPRRVLSVVLVAFVMASAGCLSGSGGATKEAQSSGGSKVTEKRSERPDLVGTGFGAVEGTVREAAGVPVKGAHVSLLGSSHFKQTDAKGQFAFSNVTARVWLIRVDATGFISGEVNFTVEEGKVTTLEIRLERPSSDYTTEAHRHDDWGEATVLDLWDFTFTPVWSLGIATPQYYGYCPYNSACQAMAPIPLDKPVPAGTGRVQVTFTFAPSMGAKELGFRVVTAGDKARDVFGRGLQVLDLIQISRPSGVAFNVPVFPNEADPAHQKFSDWEFWATIPGTPLAAPTVQPPVTKLDSIRVQITAFKGVTPLEPPHPDFWKGRSEVALMTDWKRGPGGCTGVLGYDYPNQLGSSGDGQGSDPERFRTAAVWIPEYGEFIPPGTKELRGEMSWTHKDPTVNPTKWRLLYKPANAPTPTTNWWTYAKSVPVAEEGASSFKFVIKPLKEETDQFYQSRTYWRFVVDDGMDPIPSSNYQANSGCGAYWTLSLTAIKDPAYVGE